jgi:hypothetical protein
MKNINSIKTILKKNQLKKYVGKHCSKAKIMWGNTVAIHNVLKNNKAKISISSI